MTIILNRIAFRNNTISGATQTLDIDRKIEASEILFSGKKCIQDVKAAIILAKEALSMSNNTRTASFYSKLSSDDINFIYYLDDFVNNDDNSIPTINYKSLYKLANMGVGHAQLLYARYCTRNNKVTNIVPCFKEAIAKGVPQAMVEFAYFILNHPTTQESSTEEIYNLYVAAAMLGHEKARKFVMAMSIADDQYRPIEPSDFWTRIKKEESITNKNILQELVEKYPNMKPVSRKDNTTKILNASLQLVFGKHQDLRKAKALYRCAQIQNPFINHNYLNGLLNPGTDLTLQLLRDYAISNVEFTISSKIQKSFDCILGLGNSYAHLYQARKKFEKGEVAEAISHYRFAAKKGLKVAKEELSAVDNNKRVQSFNSGIPSRKGLNSPSRCRGGSMKKVFAKPKLKDAILKIPHDRLDNKELLDSLKSLKNWNEFIPGSIFKYTTEIPNHIFRIDNQQFKDYVELTNISIHNNVTEIGRSAFEGCLSLEEITIPPLVTKINPSTFKNCMNLKHCIIPDNVTYIGSEAFQNCSSLTSITIPKNVKYISEDAFKNCINLETIVLPNGLEYIGENAFKGCKKLKYVKILDSTANDHKTVSTNAVNMISNGAFHGCQSLIDVSIPNGITDIGASAFKDCTNLFKICFSSNLKNIHEYAFANCSLLAQITLPNSLQNIMESAFFSCSQLKNILIKEQTTSQCTVQTVNKEIEGIRKYAFRYCTSLVKIMIPCNIANIFRNAFRDCKSIVDLVVSNNIGIDTYAFPSIRTALNVTIIDKDTTHTTEFLEKMVETGQALSLLKK